MAGILLSQIPPEVYGGIAASLYPYSTVLVKATPELARLKKPPLHIGSGTLVRIGQLYGILTAQHVARKIEGECALGLALIQHEHIHLIERQYLDVVHVASAIVPADGPDLAFVVLPVAKVGAIGVVKSFWNLSLEREKMLSNPLGLHEGIWFLCGAPGELTKQEESAIGYDGVISFHGMCYAAGADRQFEREGYDYIELDVEYKDGTNIPSTFGGMSGGGLWQVPIGPPEGEEIILLKPRLSGVIFYESAIADRHRFIRCHGPRSIYQNVYDAVKAKYPGSM